MSINLYVSINYNECSCLLNYGDILIIILFQLVSDFSKPSDVIVHDILQYSDTTARNVIGQTILFEAIEHECPEHFIKRLFYYGVNIASRDKYGRTARDYAEITNSPDYCRVIDEHVLGYVNECNIERIEALMVQGYDHLLDVVDSSGKTVLDIVSDGCSSQLNEVMKKAEPVKVLTCSSYFTKLKFKAFTVLSFLKKLF